MNTKVDEGKLISEKEAKLAWASGKDIELCYKQHEEENTWFLLLSTDPLSTFDRDDFLFRLKPRTITINGIEMPAPFEPKKGDQVWVIDSHCDCGYIPSFFNSAEPKYTQFGAWRTEEEIKQVVTALRFVLKGGWHEH